MTATSSTENRHSVTLPHPSRSAAPSVGTCLCGWTVTYGWGSHRTAAAAAGTHIIEEGRALPIEAQDLPGMITLIEGVSL